MAAAGGIAVIGAGSWGTALAVLLARHGQSTCLWGRDRARIEAMAATRENGRYLPGIELPPALRLSTRLEVALDGASDVLLAVPSEAFADALDAVARAAPGQRSLCWATKGFEPRSGRFLDALAAERLGEASARALLSGPTFAGEVARGLPTAVTLAGNDDAYLARLAGRFHGPDFRVYPSRDLVGVQVAGAVKNVLAIAAGIADGLRLGANTRAALITRGLAEITRLGVALGGRAETFVGLAGLGDLLLTSSDDQSRNRRFGIALARGADVAAAEKGVGQVVEGLRNTREVVRLASQAGVEMPIAGQVHRVLFEGTDPRDAVRALLGRDLKSEL